MLNESGGSGDIGPRISSPETSNAFRVQDAVQHSQFFISIIQAQ
jgi:hypothetical protein